ncbi:polysaccharide biosynthesis tyrosine autokinase [Terriglobus sp. TAA 43]|uniref:GumC family protein n=1 Tax=Terriglobus sp. TAA 43 TaxID=278961 RepID=UPI0018DE87A0|nr:polysaccharide biosynthesis tyrosine autokinase [Terriglobus sp. TAA 43]
MKLRRSEGGIETRLRSQHNRDLSWHNSEDDPYSPDSQSEEHHQPSMPAEYLQTVLRHRWLIAGIMLAGVTLSILLHLTTQPLYQARTSVEIQPMNSDFMDAKNVAPTATLPSDILLQTQIKLLSSEALSERVQTLFKGESHPDLVMQNDLLSRLLRALHLRSGSEIPYDDLIEDTAKNVKVKPVGISQLIEVTCGSWDAAFAARYCNALISEFQEIDLESRGTQAKHISDWLVRQAADIRQKAEESQHRLEIATGGNGLLLNSPADAMGEQRLHELQTELVRAQADRMQKQAELAEMRDGSADASPDSPAYMALKSHLSDLQAQEAALSNLTDANPKMIHLHAQIAETQRSMEHEKSVTTSKLQEAFQAAKHREDLLGASYHTLEGTVSSTLEKSSEIEILRREVQSEQQLYQTLLQRAKEAGFASAVPASTIRIVDAARIPKFSIYPQRGMNAVFGALLGLIVGLAIAFFLERQVPRLRLPGDIGRFIKLDELGVIPSPHAELELAARNKPALQDALSLSLAPLRTGATPRGTSTVWRDEALVAEAYRNTTFSVLLSQPDRRSRVFVVTSPEASEGKTTVVTNLGIALSKAKLRVALVDGDLRKPRLHEMLGVDNNKGLRNLLIDGVAAHEEQLDQFCKQTSYENLFLIPSGTGKASISDLLHSAQLDVLFGKLSNAFDVVLIDSPPVLHISDARILAGHASRTILVFRSGVTKRANAVTVRNMLLRDRVTIAGSILNDFDPKREGQRQYYKGYYEYSGTGADREATT